MSKTYDNFQKADSADRAGKGAVPMGRAPATPEPGGAPPTRMVKALAFAIVAVVAVTVAIAIAFRHIYGSPAIEVVRRPDAPPTPFHERTPKIIDVTPAPSQPEFPPDGPAPEAVSFITTVEVVGAPPEAAVADPDEAAPARPDEGVVVAQLPDGPPVDLRREADGRPDVGTGVREGVSDFLRARSLQEAGQFDEAVEYYRSVLLDHPNHAGAHNNLGIIYQHKRDYARAADAYRKAIAAAPLDYRGYNNLATCLIEMGKYEEAVASLRRSLDLSPDNFSALCNMGVAHTGMRNFEQAERYLLQAVEKYPARLRGMFNLANVYRHKNDRHEAIRYYQRFLRLSAGRHPAQDRAVAEILSSLQAPPEAQR